MPYCITEGTKLQGHSWQNNCKMFPRGRRQNCFPRAVRFEDNRLSSNLIAPTSDISADILVEANGPSRLQWKQGNWVGNARLPAHEGEMGDSAGATHRLHTEALFESLQPSPQRFPAPEYDGHQGNVHVIDQVPSQELADGRRPPPMRTSRAPAASRAAARASAGLASMKWNVVPPSNSIDGLG